MRENILHAAAYPARSHEVPLRAHPLKAFLFSRREFWQAPADTPFLANSHYRNVICKGSELGAFWKYRVGDWRLICEIREKQILITVLSLGNRREVYH